MRREEQRVGKKREGERRGGKEREGETEVLREGRRERRRKGRREGGTKERKRGNRREEGGEKKKCPAPPRMLLNLAPRTHFPLYTLLSKSYRHPPFALLP